MKSETGFYVRPMTTDDINNVRALWMTIKGFGIRTIDDSEEFVERFIRRNPKTSIVACLPDGSIVGSILCGSDGRNACFYHVCVSSDYRRRGIGRAMVRYAMDALKREHINKVTLIAFKGNEVGNLFWNAEGFIERDDINYYEMPLNDDNITHFNV